MNSKLAEDEGQIEPTRRVNLTLAITKELKNIKNKHVENNLDVVFFINYLNEKVAERLVQARYGEGYHLDKFKTVIDQMAEWSSLAKLFTTFNVVQCDGKICCALSIISGII